MAFEHQGDSERCRRDVVVELLHKLAGRVVNNGAITSRLDLVQHLANDTRLAAAGVADDQEMLVLRIPRNPQWQL